MAWLLTVALTASAGAGAGLLLWFEGERTFVTHPVSLLALAAAAIGVVRLAGSVGGAVRLPVHALAASLAIYLVLGVWATAAPSAVAAGLWSVGWMAPNALLAVVGLVAGGRGRIALAVTVSTAVVMAAGTVLVRPVVPFEGIATVAPEGWSSAAPGVVDGLLVCWNLALVAATVGLAVSARRVSILDRRGLARASAVASCAPCLVVTCYALAVLRDPGDVDPTAGSIAYIAAVAALSALAAWGLVTDDRLAIRVMAGVWAASGVVLAGIGLAGGLLGSHVALGVLVVVAMTCVVVGAVVVGVARFERWSARPSPRPASETVPGLTARENDVLAGVAHGSTNAGIAQDLFLSERTVEQHLRSIFDKLALGDPQGSNRRVRAAAIWWEHQPGRAREA